MTEEEFDREVAAEACLAARGLRPLKGSGRQRRVVIGYWAEAPATCCLCVGGEDLYYGDPSDLDPEDFTYRPYADRRTLAEAHAAVRDRHAACQPKPIETADVNVGPLMVDEAMAIIHARGGIRGTIEDDYHKRRELLPLEGGVAVVLEDFEGASISLHSIWPGWAEQTRAAVLEAEDALDLTLDP